MPSHTVPSRQVGQASDLAIYSIFLLQAPLIFLCALILRFFLLLSVFLFHTHTHTHTHTLLSISHKPTSVHINCGPDPTTISRVTTIKALYTGTCTHIAPNTLRLFHFVFGAGLITPGSTGKVSHPSPASRLPPDQKSPSAFQLCFPVLPLD